MLNDPNTKATSVAHFVRLALAGAVLSGVVLVALASSAQAASCAIGSGNCPGAPTSVVASVTSSPSGSALVTWAAPSDTGSGVTGYAITAYQGATQVSTTTVGKQFSVTVTGLTNGTSYTFTVAGAVATGYGAASVASNAVAPATVPGPATAVTASSGNASATVSWNAPVSDGGAAVSSYKVTATPGGFSATVSGSVLSATVNGLTNGTPYTFSVVATNSQGSGTVSDPSSAVTPSSGTASVPDTPPAPTGTGSSGQVTLNWAAPANNGGASITSYVVKAFQGATLVSTLSVSAPSTSVVVTGLTNGLGYTFDVAAVNSVGTGNASPLSSSIAVAQNTQTITFTNPGPGTLGGTASLSATGGGSGNAVVFSVDLRSASGACSVSGSQVSFTGAGTCVIDANQAGNANYAAAPQVAQSVTVAVSYLTITAANHTVTFGAATPTNSSSVSGFVGSDAASVASATYTYAGSSTTTYAASTTPPTAVGTYSVTPSAATLNFSVGSANKYLSTYVAGTYTITPVTLVLAFTSAPTGVTNGEASGTHSVRATATPNQGSVVYSSATPGVCSVGASSGALTVLESGTCTIDANAGNANYVATQVSQSIVVLPASGGSGSSTSTTGPTNAPPPSGIIPDDLGTPASISASATSPTTDLLVAGGASDSITVPAGALPVGTTFSAYPITNSSSLVSQVPSGEKYVVALALSWQAPDGSSPTASVPITVTISDPSIVVGDVIYELTSAGLTEVGVATLNGEVTFSFNSDPTFIVAHAVASASPQGALSVTSLSGTLGRALTLTFSGGSGSGAVSFSVTNGTATGCVVTAGALYARSAGTCLVTVSKAADTNYQAANSVAAAVSLSLPARPRALTLGFAPRANTLGGSQRRALVTLASNLVAGASVTVVGYARANVALARARVAAVVAFLVRRVKVHVTSKTVTALAANKITVVTTKQ